MFKSARTNFINFADKGFRYYEAYFEINKLGNTYEVLFICPPAEKTGYGANAKATPTFSDYYFNTVSLDNQQFSQDIRKIILESENNFENFKGDKVDMGYSFFQNYSSKFQVSGITNCYIEKHTARIVNFVIPLLENTDIETLKKQSPLLIQNLMAALGTDYAYNVSEDQTKVVFVNKNSPQKKVVTFLIQQKGNGFNVNIYINADSQI